MLWINTHRELHTSGIVELVFEFKEQAAAFYLNQFQRLGRIEFVVIVHRRAHSNQFNADAVLILDIFHIELGVEDEFLTYARLLIRFVATYAQHLNLIPLGSHILFPSSNLFGFLEVIGLEQRVTFSEFIVELIEVIVHHTLGREARSNLRHGVLDILYPLRAVTFTIARIVQRNNLGLEHLVDGCSIELVLVSLVLVCTMFGQSPTCTFYITFVPPTILDGEVKHAVHLGFLTRCTGSLERTGRRIEPDIHTTNQTFSQTHIVVLEEDNLTEELRHTANLNNTLNQALSCAVGRVRFTGEQELYRIIRVIHQFVQTLQIREQQVSTFVGCKTASKTDNQGLRVHLVECTNDASRITLALHPVLAELHLDIVNQFLFQHHTRCPYLLIRNIGIGLPHIEVRLVFPPAFREFSVIDLFPLRSGPSRHMHTVGHIVHV